MDFVSRQYDFGEGDPPVVIGEIGVNHNGDVALARRLIDVAVDAGVQVVKFQAFKTEKEISRFAELAPYQKENSPEALSQFDLCKALELPDQAFRDLKAYCDERRIGFLCSVFDFDSVDLIAGELGATAVKIASGEVTNTPLLEYVARRKLGVILSTGASTMPEVAEAVATLQRAGCPELVLLHCVSNYPAPMHDLNLRAMTAMRDAFGLPTGFSDHTMGVEAAVAATALGAVCIEKHFTLSHDLEGPDHKASAEPDELRRLVAAVTAVKGALGDGIKRPMPSEMANLPLIRRSLVAVGALRKGDALTRERVEIKRPADGIDPRRLDEALGRTLARDVADDEPITWECLA
jgi:N,N'-diacetyllegionaminate synthase